MRNYTNETTTAVVNGLAHRFDWREGDRNLNWSLPDYPAPVENEDRIANVLCSPLRAHDLQMDMHSLSAEGPTFAQFGPK